MDFNPITALYIIVILSSDYRYGIKAQDKLGVRSTKGFRDLKLDLGRI